MNLSIILVVQMFFSGITSLECSIPSQVPKDDDFLPIIYLKYCVAISSSCIMRHWWRAYFLSSVALISLVTERNMVLYASLQNASYYRIVFYRPSVALARRCRLQLT